MIKGLIQVLLVSMGVVSPTNTPSFNKETKNAPIKYANESHFDTNIYQYGQGQHTFNQTTVQTDETYDYDQISNHYVKRTETNNFLAIYEETTQCYIRGLIGQQPNEYITKSNHDTTRFTIIQLTPYRTLVDNHIYLDYVTNIQYGLPSGTTIYTECITTIENLSSYVGSQNWATKDQNYNNYLAITSPTQGYNYTSQYVNGTYREGNEDVEVGFDIDLVYGKTNYIVFYQEVRLPQAIHEYTYTLTSSAQYYSWSYSDLVEIEGTFILPINNYEVIDVPGLMWIVLTMPFSFISTAFNLTLWPGTPYQINISQIFLVVIGLLVFIWIISKLIRTIGK